MIQCSCVICVHRSLECSVIHAVIADQSLSRIKVNSDKPTAVRLNSADEFDSAMESLAKPVKTRNSLDRSRSTRDSRRARMLPC